MLDRIRGKSQSIFTQVIFGLIILAFVFFGVGNFSGSGSSVVAKVNGDKITIQEYFRIFQMAMDYARQEDPDVASKESVVNSIKKQVLDELIAQRLLEQQAEKIGLFVSPYELARVIHAIELFKNKKGQFDAKLYDEYLQQNAVTPTQFENNFRKQLLLEKLQTALSMTAGATEEEAKNFVGFLYEKRTAEYVLFPYKKYLDGVEIGESAIADYYTQHQELFQIPAMMNVDYVIVTPQALSKQLTITGEALSEYYEAHKQDFIQPEQYKLRHIFVAFPSQTTAGQAEAEQKMNGIVLQLEKGKSFAELAKQFSNDTANAAQGGDIGWGIPQDDMIPGWSQAVASLKVGEVTKVLKSETGLHLFALDDKKAASAKPLAEVKDQVRDILAREEALTREGEVRKQIVEELVAGTPLEVIAQQHGLTLEKSGLKEKTELEKTLQLHEDAMKVLENVPIGEVAPAPLNINDGVVLVKVTASQPERLKELPEVKDEIVRTLSLAEAKQRAQNAADQALKELFASSESHATFVKDTQVTKPFYRSLPFIAELGAAQDLARDLNRLDEGQWSDRVYATPEGAVVARVKTVTGASEEELQQLGGQNAIKMLTSKRVNEAFQAFLATALASSEIEENLQALEQIR